MRDSEMTKMRKMKEHVKKNNSIKIEIKIYCKNIYQKKEQHRD